MAWAILLVILVAAISIGLDIWALWWLYHFVVHWATTGVIPSFGSFVWAAILVFFVSSSFSFSAKKSSDR